MSTIRLLYRDFDRAPYLYTVKHCAARHGLDLEVTKAELGGRYPEFLLEGATDFLAENYWGLQSQRLAGEPIVSVATAVTSLNEKLFVHPGINSIADLRGKKFAVRGIGPSQFIPALWLKDHGLNDVTPVVYSEDEVGRWGQWKKVVSGECHGTFVTNFYQNDPLGAGLKLMPVEPYGFIGNVTLTTTQGFIDSRREDVAKLVLAAFEASQLFKHDEAKAMEISCGEPMKLLGIKDKKEMKSLYAILREELSEQPVPSAEGISNTRRMRLPKSPELATFNPLLMWDFSFAREAADKMKGTK
jgi:ABC-type nitrate/sulfonate/bicarbonate transport system substrate-binding protein